MTLFQKIVLNKKNEELKIKGQVDRKTFLVFFYKTSEVVIIYGKGILR